MTQIINEPTHNKGKILDLVLCNPSAQKLLLSSSVLNPLSSSCDHFLISFNINHKSKNKTSPVVRYPVFRKAKYEVINHEIREFLNNHQFYFNRPT